MVLLYSSLVYLVILVLEEQQKNTKMIEIENYGAPWLKQLLKANFYVVCQSHKDYGYNKCNRYCIECSGNPFCVYCLDDHKNHKVVQIRRSSLSNAVRVDDIKKHINVVGVQTYTINKGQIVFLNSRAYKELPSGVINICNICHHSLPSDNFKFCSLGCKREAVSHDFPKQTLPIETNLSTHNVDDNFQNGQSSTPGRKLKVRRLLELVRKSSVASASVAKQVTSSICPATAPVFNHVNSRKRKGIPRRAPLA